MVLTKYPFLKLSKEMVNRSSWDAQHGHVNSISRYKVATQLQQKGILWIAMPIKAFLTQASQLVAPAPCPSQKRQAAERKFPMPKRPPDVHY
uniref:Uncharacterized protein n=1 Tax=Plectus sambesii TaxID=2011161 RepID=A0A914VHF2_9BILA